MKKILKYLASGIFCGIAFVALSIFSAQHVLSATLYAGSATETVYAGQTFVVEWYLNSGNQSINAVNVGLTFSTSTIKLTDISTAGSSVSLWINSPNESMSGTITALGGIPAGVLGVRIPLFRTTFTAIKSGTVSFGLVSGSQTLRSDGVGTSDGLIFSPLKFSVVDVVKQNLISSPTHPNQSEWYHRNDVTLIFPVEGNTEYNYSFSSNPEIIPGVMATTTTGKVTYKDVSDGLYYFKLASRTVGGLWQEFGVYRVQIDSLSPEKFAPMISRDPNVFGGKTFLSFNTTDKTSGLDKYEIKSGLFGFYRTIQSPYVLSRPWIGDGVTVRAVDNAGNYTDKFVEYSGYVSAKVFAIVLFVLAVLSLIAYKLLYQRVYNKKNIRS